ncbi:MAG: hypothetical protein A2075_07080 [Geobacteraceae bacterium GWC2_58_44]|nr:MAG: hypothetical protein A2075_07080 [Geobacteraceae bacterium GWC2_58_44]
MKILEYAGFDASRHKSQYRKVVASLECGDFRSADVKKLTNLSHGKFYRAKLDHANRLLFTLVRHGEEVYALMLEVIENHAYEKSRFLRGAQPDEDKLPDLDAAGAAAEAEPVRYIHPKRREVHLLDKVISFDDAQQAVYLLPPPLIVVGSAGSGKTALTLEKLKHAEGEVLYVTLSAYLAQGARELYYANGFEKEGQDTTFFSFPRIPGKHPGAQGAGSLLARFRRLVRPHAAAVQGTGGASGLRGDPRGGHLSTPREPSGSFTT